MCTQSNNAPSTCRHAPARPTSALRRAHGWTGHTDEPVTVEMHPNTMRELYYLFFLTTNLSFLSIGLIVLPRELLICTIFLILDAISPCLFYRKITTIDTSTWTNGFLVFRSYIKGLTDFNGSKTTMVSLGNKNRLLNVRARGSKVKGSKGISCFFVYRGLYGFRRWLVASGRGSRFSHGTGR
jgi:hypothetical protein